ncbi:MAG: PilZ domain-containing protein [Elusimicrobiota bacterium]|nr:PilZ domain-containing protein [Elusimicrobiota bacterium]
MNDAEKRKSKRFPVLYHLIKPVLIRTQDSKAGISSPAIMVNLSTGGMALLTFSPLPVGKNILISFDLKDLKIDNVKSRVVRVENKEGSYILGIQFLNLKKEIADTINKLADDFDSCETRILLGEKPVCRKGCSYFEHCQRIAKGHY